MFTLRALSPEDGRDIYNMLQEMPKEENGFQNGAYGLTYEEYKEWLQRQDEIARGKNLPEGFVPQTVYWLMENGIPVGEGKIRHFLSPALEKRGGHIGYGIRPGFRGQGRGKVLLGLLLQQAAARGIPQALVTVDPSNGPSQGVCRHCGGQPAGGPPGQLRYWVPTGLKIK